MNLSVLSVAFPFAPVRPDAVGGAEQVLQHIDAALVRAGHRSVVLAAAGSRVRGRLVAIDVPTGPIGADDRRRAWGAWRDAIGHAIRRHEIDVVHMHGVDFHEYLPPPGRVPVLATLHLPPSWYPAQVFDGGRRDIFLHCVSRSQHASCPPGARLLAPIENGVVVRERRPRVRRRGFALALGRIAPEKNLHAALAAAYLANVPLVLAGQVFPYESHERYFACEIATRLDDARRFVGPIGPRTKHRLLARARCLLVPSLAPETSSLVAMEALACGTPVIAYARGALPEIVEHGVTGFLVHDTHEMADAIGRCDDIDPARCHAAALARFSIARSVEKYLDAYRDLVEGHRPA
jgi:glycosyltransferase involved in cell wall biosynthesis